MKDQNIVFALESERRRNIRIHDRPAARELWAKLAAGADKAEATCLVTGKARAGRQAASLHQGCMGRADGRRVDHIFQPRCLHLLRPRTGRQRARLRGGHLCLRDGAQPFPRKRRRPPDPDWRCFDCLLGGGGEYRSRQGCGGYFRQLPGHRREASNRQNRRNTESDPRRAAYRGYQAGSAGWRPFLRTSAVAERGAAFGPGLCRGRFRRHRRALRRTRPADANRAAAA
jgi:CRISPR-associated protein (Cas_Csd1)